MKDRATWAFVVFALLVLGAIYLLRNKPAKVPAPVPAKPAPTSSVSTPTIQPSAPAQSASLIATGPQPAATASPGAPVPMIQMGRNGPRVPIQDGKTIDMSSGRPVVLDDARSRAAIDKAVKEMDAAASEVTFKSSPSAVTKKSEPPAPAPKP